MHHPIPSGVFKPNPSTGEKRNDTSTRVAQEITANDRRLREAKTTRLRDERLAREALIGQEKPEPIKRKGKT